MAYMLACCLIAAATFTCSGHSAQDLAQLLGRFREANPPEARLEVLEKIAALYVDETSDRGITNAVVEALKDEQRRVGTRAAKLLGSGLNGDIALDGLVEAASRLRGEEAKFMQGQRDAIESFDIAGEDVETRLKRLKDRFRDATLRTRERFAYRNALTQALLLRRDDRCATGLSYLLVLRLHQEDALPIVDGLLALGTRPAVASVMDVFEHHERVLRSRKKQRNKLARQALREQPGHWKRTSGEWKDKERIRVASALEAFDVQTKFSERWLKKVAKSLRAYASSQGLPDAPRSAKRIQWKSWWREALSEVPTSLTGE